MTENDDIPAQRLTPASRDNYDGFSYRSEAYISQHALLTVPSDPP